MTKTRKISWQFDDLCSVLQAWQWRLTADLIEVAGVLVEGVLSDGWTGGN